MTLFLCTLLSFHLVVDIACITSHHQSLPQTTKCTLILKPNSGHKYPHSTAGPNLKNEFSKKERKTVSLDREDVGPFTELPLYGCNMTFETSIYQTAQDRPFLIPIFFCKCLTDSKECNLMSRPSGFPIERVVQSHIWTLEFQSFTCDPELPLDATPQRKKFSPI